MSIAEKAEAFLAKNGLVDVTLTEKKALPEALKKFQKKKKGEEEPDADDKGGKADGDADDTGKKAKCESFLAGLGLKSVVLDEMTIADKMALNSEKTRLKKERDEDSPSKERKEAIEARLATIGRMLSGAVGDTQYK